MGRSPRAISNSPVSSWSVPILTLRRSTTTTLAVLALLVAALLPGPRAAAVVPMLSVDDVTVTEGDSGPVLALFTVSLVPASAVAVTVAAAVARNDRRPMCSSLKWSVRCMDGVPFVNDGGRSQPTILRTHGVIQSGSPVSPQ